MYVSTCSRADRRGGGRLPPVVGYSANCSPEPTYAEMVEAAQLVVRRCRLNDGISSALSPTIDVVMVRSIGFPSLSRFSGTTNDALCKRSGTTRTGAPRVLPQIEGQKHRGA